MRSVLLDEGVPVGIRKHLEGCTVRTAAEAGWAGMTNGALIAAAETAGYQVLITADQNIRYQQNLAGRQLALVVLETNRWDVINGSIGAVQSAVGAAVAGSYASVPFDRPPLRRRTFNRVPPDGNANG